MVDKNNGESEISHILHTYIYIYLRYSLPLRHGMQSLSLMMHKWVRNQQTRLDFLRVYLNPP